MAGGKKGHIPSEYICPKCSSTSWKNPTSFFEAISPISSEYECKDCGYIGVFFAVDNARETKLNHKKMHRTNFDEKKKSLENDSRLLMAKLRQQ
jgi:rubredoxin